ncbi:MAG: hypothetical protein ACR2OJ_16200 [Hyphomicrobiales bacterium]
MFRLKSLLEFLIGTPHGSTRNVLSLIVSFVAGIGLVLMSFPPASQAQNFEQLIPERGSATARSLQNALYDAGCFPPGTTVAHRTDGWFGSTPGARSRLAIRNYLSATRRKASDFRNATDLTNRIVAWLNINKPRKICSTIAGPGICRRDSLLAKFLGSLEKSLPGVGNVVETMRALHAAMDNGSVSSSTASGATSAVANEIRKFEPDAVPLDSDSQARIDTYGVKRFTLDQGRSSLKEAADSLENIILSQAIQWPECKPCMLINDWIYLRNIAAANGGFLISKQWNKSVFYRFDVNKITQQLLDEEVRMRVRVYRSMTTRLNSELQSGNYDAEFVSNLVAQRDAQMFLIVKRFHDNRNSNKAKNSPLLKDSPKCIGFDGSAIYQ